MKSVRRALPVLISFIIFTACSSSAANTAEITPEQNEHQLIKNWFENGIKDNENFTDKLNYQYYARTLGLDKDYFLSADAWEIYYNDRININRDIDGKVIYLIRLDPNKLLDIYAKNNNTGVPQICDFLGQTQEQLYYNWGYTMTSYKYEQNHNDNICSYSNGEKSVFGDHNGEDREIVMGTHILTIENNEITYSTSSDRLATRRRDLIRQKQQNRLYYGYSEYAEEERLPAFYVNNVGISRVIALNLLNGYSPKDEEDPELSIEDKSRVCMINVSPYSYGCTTEDIIDLFPAPVVTETETETEAVTTETSESVSK